MSTPCQQQFSPYLILLFLYIVPTISILIGQEPPAYFENLRNFVDKHDYSIICYPILVSPSSGLMQILHFDWLRY